MNIKLRRLKTKRDNTSSYERRLAVILIAAVLLGSTCYASVQPDPVEFTCSRGLRLKILQNSYMGFIHAQLVIYHQGWNGNPAVPYLTWMNLFERDVDRSGSSLLGILKKLGNDYEVEYRADFLVLKVNFLPDRMPLFVRFLKGVYNYRPFSEVYTGGSTYSELKKERLVGETFRESVAHFWKHFFKRKEWKKQIAFQIAYQYLFPQSALGNVFITPKKLYSVTLDHIISFYRDTYRLDNSLLVIKGNIERPALIYGTIEQAFSSTRKYPPRKPVDKKITITNKKKFFLFNVRDSESPIIYWFEAISTFKNRDPIPALILNNILFAHPTGRLFKMAPKLKIGLIYLTMEMLNHRTVSVICNTVSLRYRDIERFLLLAEREKKKLDSSDVDRREFLNTMANLIGHIKVSSRYIENDVNIEKMKISSNIVRVTLAALNRVDIEPGGEVVVIVGNAKTVMENLSAHKSQVEIIDFNINL